MKDHHQHTYLFWFSGTKGILSTAFSGPVGRDFEEEINQICMTLGVLVMENSQKNSHSSRKNHDLKIISQLKLKMFYLVLFLGYYKEFKKLNLTEWKLERDFYEKISRNFLAIHSSVENFNVYGSSSCASRWKSV